MLRLTRRRQRACLYGELRRAGMLAPGGPRGGVTAGAQARAGSEAPPPSTAKGCGAGEPNSGEGAAGVGELSTHLSGDGNPVGRVGSEDAEAGPPLGGGAPAPRHTEVTAGAFDQPEALRLG